MASLLSVVVLTGATVAVLSVNLSQNREVNGTWNDVRSLYLADAGVSRALLEVSASKAAKTTPPTGIGAKAAPVKVKAGKYWATIVDKGDDSFRVTSTGSFNMAERTVEAVLAPSGQSAFNHAIFAGNSSGDPLYTLGLGGFGGQADSVTGNIYTGGNAAIWGDATVAGEILSSGLVVGSAGTEGVTRPLPDVVGMDYAANNDVDVAAEFAGGTALWDTDDLGGNAWELPEANPAHIFRMNPDDRPTEIADTAKDDYFLEDPHGPATDWVYAANGMDGHTITLSGHMGTPGSGGNGVVYYIDGNLWIHNEPFGSLRFQSSDAEPLEVTFVVNGNLYVSDDVLMDGSADNGVAFIAIVDPAEPDSGNIYLGDPRFGTLDHMETFLYAENNFFDNNLDAAGSKSVSIDGVMTAGNHVDIQRDYFDGTTIQHSKLTVDFDDRLATGAVKLPGIPLPVMGSQGYAVVFWKEISD